MLKQFLRVPVIQKCLTQTDPVGFRKQIEKALYLIEKTLSLQINREL